MDTAYPRLDSSQVRDFIDKVVRFGPTEASVSGFIARSGVGKLAQSAEIDALVNRLLVDCGDERGRALEPVEAKHCGPIFTVLDGLPDAALGDPQFWSFLAVRHFWEFVERRQPAAWNEARGHSFDSEDGADERHKLERYLIGKDHYQLPLRMYLRAQSVRDGDNFGLTEIDGGGTDFWRSQILGVRTSHYPPVARSVARTQAVAELNVEEQRPPGRRVNRLRVNIEFFTHGDDDARAIVENVWQVLPEDRLELATKKARKTVAKKAVAKKAVAKKTARGS